MIVKGQREEKYLTKFSLAVIVCNKRHKVCTYCFVAPIWRVKELTIQPPEEIAKIGKEKKISIGIITVPAREFQRNAT